MKIRVLGAHQCESITTKCFSLLIDEVLAVDAGSLTSSLSFDEQQRIRAILLTHYHYDHIKDIPTLGLNTLRSGKTRVFSTEVVKEALFQHILNGDIWPDLTELPSAQQPTMTFHSLEPGQALDVDGYEVLPVPVRHAVPTVGYQIACNGRRLFYTGDTGGRLAPVWKCIEPDLLITEVTFADVLVGLAHQAEHLTPCLLKEELKSFRRIKGYLPAVLVVHVNPAFEQEIRTQIEKVAADLGTKITVAHEGLQLDLA